MAVKIRLTRLGRKKLPYYRIIVADVEAKRDGRIVEEVLTTPQHGHLRRAPEVNRCCRLVASRVNDGN